MGYTALAEMVDELRLRDLRDLKGEEYEENTLEGAALAFIRNTCQDLRFSPKIEAEEKREKDIYQGTSQEKGQIPYNVEMDIDRLCLENAVRRFLESGRKEDAFDVYFCYLEMFVGDYKKTRRMIELLSEFEANGSGLLMKHRDHYVHSVYVFILGLALYQTNEVYREKYEEYYKVKFEGNNTKKAREAACHFLEYWGLTSLFHDIGYPFELPFEQVASYFEVEGIDRTKRPFVAYHALDSFVEIDKAMAKKIAKIYDEKYKEKNKYRDKTEAIFETTDEMFAYDLSKKLSETYWFTKEQMLRVLKQKPTEPNKFNQYMDHAYFSATILFKKLFCEIGCTLKEEHIDALTAILMHNSLYKFSIAYYKDENKKQDPFEAELHPLAYMLMLCDELQCWDRTSYGRNSKKELHPVRCKFSLSDESINVTYYYDEKEKGEIERFKEGYKAWSNMDEKEKKDQRAFWKERESKFKAYLAMDKDEKFKEYLAMNNKDKKAPVGFREDIERIVNLGEIKLIVNAEFKDVKSDDSFKNFGHLSDSNFINLYNFAIVLHGRWEGWKDWKRAKDAKAEEKFLSDPKKKDQFAESFSKLSLEYKISNINQAKAFARYLAKIDCFYTDKAVEFDPVEEFKPWQLEKIGPLEHQRWLQEHYDMGWQFGPDAELELEKRERSRRRECSRRHHDMLPPEDFPDFDPQKKTVSEEQAKKNFERLRREAEEKGESVDKEKDTAPMECMLAMLKMYDGVRIYSLKPVNEEM